VGGPLRQSFAELKDASLVEKIPVGILVFCLFAMGLAPGWIITLLNGAIAPIFNNLHR